jgi:hypothetical protein
LASFTENGSSNGKVRADIFYFANKDALAVLIRNVLLRNNLELICWEDYLRDSIDEVLGRKGAVFVHQMDYCVLHYHHARLADGHLGGCT